MPRLRGLLVGDYGTTVVGINDKVAPVNPPREKDALVLFLLLQHREGPHRNGADKSEYRARLQQITVNVFRLGNLSPLAERSWLPLRTRRSPEPAERLSARTHTYALQIPLLLSLPQRYLIFSVIPHKWKS